MERLWTPWRMRYVGGDTHDSTCIFCTKPMSGDDVAELILYRGTDAFVIMNLYPYNTGHVMLVPNAHVSDVSELSPDALHGLTDLLPWVTAAQRRALRCSGFNVGLNLGSVAGAGIAEHLHVHVVPRWEGDANFMPILANTMVLPELIPVTYAKLRAELEISMLGKEPAAKIVPQAGAVVYVPSERTIALRRAADGTMVLPKGHIEAGEPAWRAAVREVKEEMGLESEIRDWAGSARFEHGGEDRQVVYFAVSAEPGPSFARHLGSDTFLFEPAEAVRAADFESDRTCIKAAIKRLGLTMGSAS